MVHPLLKDGAPPPEKNPGSAPAIIVESLTDHLKALANTFEVCLNIIVQHNLVIISKKAFAILPSQQFVEQPHACTCYNFRTIQN